MLPSVQSTNLPSVTAESFNPDQITVVVAQLFVSISEASRMPESLIGSIAEINIERQEAVNLSNALIARRDQAGRVVTAESIDAALKNGTSLTSLFGSDPGSLGFNLEQAQNLMADAHKLGVAIVANLRYPVIVISSSQDKEKEEHLVWMSQAERLSLDMYPVEENKHYAPYQSRLKEDESQTILYVLLDDQANFRTGHDALNDAIIQATESSSRGEANINIEQMQFSTVLEGVGSAIRWLLEKMASIFKNNIQAMEARREKATEEAESDRIRLIQLSRLISDLDELIEAINGAGLKNV